MAISPEIGSIALLIGQQLVWPISGLQLLKFPENGHVPAVGDFQG
jgi:hypothetical protein